MPVVLVLLLFAAGAGVATWLATNNVDTTLMVFFGVLSVLQQQNNRRD